MRVPVFILFSALIMSLSLVILNCNQNDLYSLASGENAEKIYIFTSNAVTPNGNIGGRNGADAICDGIVSSDFNSVDFLYFRAFLTVDASDTIVDTVFDTHKDLPVYGLKADGTETLIENTWNDLWDGNIIASLSTATNAPAGAQWWSGGTVGSGTNTCDSWSSTTGTSVVGGTGNTDNLWLQQAGGCVTPLTIMCVGVK